MIAQLIKTCNRLAYKSKSITVFHHCVEIKKQYYGSLNVYCIDNKNFWRVVTTNRVLVEKLYLIKDVTFSVNVGNAVVAPVLKAIVKYSVHPSIKKINK